MCWDTRPSGSSEEVGADVRGVSVGDRVVLSYVNACGTCWWCTGGQSALCERSRVHGAGAFGGDLAGAQADAVLVPGADVNLLHVPDAIDDDRAVFLGDLLPTAIASASLAAPEPGGHRRGRRRRPRRAARRRRRSSRPAPVASSSSTAKPTASPWPRPPGATAIDTRERDPEMALAALTGDRGADAVVDAVGSVAGVRGRPSTWSVAVGASSSPASTPVR